MADSQDLRAEVRREIIATPVEGVGNDPFPADGSGFYEPFVRDAPATAIAFHRYLRALEGSSTLDVRLLHLIWMGVDALVTHLFAPGAQAHARAALDHGATTEELFEVLSIACAVSNRSCELMAPMLAEELARAGHTVDDGPTTVAQQAIKDEFVERNGFWSDAMDLCMRLLPAYFPKMLALGHALESAPVLAPIERALVFVGLSASPPVLDVEGARRHVRRALELGAPPADVLSAFTACAGLGAHAFAVGVAGK